MASGVVDRVDRAAAPSAAVAPILALDLGSTAVKAARFDREARLAGPVAVVRLRKDGAAPGRMDPEHVLAAVVEAIGRVGAAGVSTVATSIVWQTALAVDRAGAAISQVRTWEAAPDEHEIALLRGRPDGPARRSVAGSPLHPSYPLLLMPDSAGAPATEIVDLGAWIIGRLSGRRPAWHEPIAAGSGVWNQVARTWLDEPGARALRSRTAGAAPAWLAGLDGLHAARWLPPLPDGLCHNLGLGAVDDTVTVTAGTSGSIRGVVAHDPTRVARAGLWYARCGARTAAVGGAVSSVGNALEWVSEFTGGAIEWDLLDDPDPRLPELRAVPDVFGRRGPDYPFDASAALLGLRPRHTLRDVRQAFAIDVWAGFARLFEAYLATEPVAAVRAGGGVIEHEPRVAQLIADALGTEVLVGASGQPALHGAARFAAHTLRTGHASVDSLVDHLRRAGEPPEGVGYRPRAAWTAALRARWEDASAA